MKLHEYCAVKKLIYQIIQFYKIVPENGSPSKASQKLTELNVRVIYADVFRGLNENKQ